MSPPTSTIFCSSIQVEWTPQTVKNKEQFVSKVVMELSILVALEVYGLNIQL